MSKEGYPTSGVLEKSGVLLAGVVLVGSGFGAISTDALVQNRKETLSPATIDNIFNGFKYQDIKYQDIKSGEDFALKSKFTPKVDVYSQTVAIDGHAQKDLTISSITHNESTRYVINVYTPLGYTHSDTVPNLSSISISVGGYSDSPYTQSALEGINYYYFSMLKSDGFWTIRRLGYNVLGNTKIPEKYELTIRDNTKLSLSKEKECGAVIAQAQDVISAARKGLDAVHKGSQIVLEGQ